MRKKIIHLTSNNSALHPLTHLPIWLSVALGTPTALAENDILEIEEIVVTAQKKTESLQDTPIAISAFNATAIEDIGIFSAADIGAYTPNATITPSLGSAFNIRMNIRGNQTAEPSLAIDPKVGIYLDGVYIARNAGSVFDVVDLERVEVLRGPQGTLWGKNTTGGALNMVTTKPSGQLNFKQQLSAGTDGYYRSVTTLDTPSVANISAKLTYALRGTDGWADNVNPAGEDELGREESEAFRIALRWDATEDLSIDYSFDRTDAEAVPIPLQPADIQVPTDDSVITLLAPSYAAVAGNVFGQMAATANGRDRLDSFDLDFQGAEFLDILGHNLTITWAATEGLELKSITGYREYTSDFSDGQDLDGGFYQAPAAADGILTDIPAFHTVNVKSQHQFSQEFQLVGVSDNERISYVLGLYHFEESGKEINPWQITFHNSGSNYLLNTYGAFYKIDSQSQAVYGQFTFGATDRLDLTLGMRYTEDEKELILLAEDPILSADEQAEDDWSEFTASFTAAYAFSDTFNVYGKIMEGFAAGVFNPGTIDRSPLTPETTEAALTPADPEETLSYELGLKSQLLDKRVRLNVALFYNDNDNLQVTDFKDAVRQTFNSGSSDAQGIEIDITALVTESITINASYGYLDVDFDDNKRRGSAANTANAGISYAVPAGSIGKLTTRLDVTYADEVFFSTSDSSVKSDAYALLNARVSLSEVMLGNGIFRAALWGRNLSDKEYIVHGANFGFYTGYTWGTPRSAGVDLIWEF